MNTLEKKSCSVEGELGDAMSVKSLFITIPEVTEVVPKSASVLWWSEFDVHKNGHFFIIIKVYLYKAFLAISGRTFIICIIKFVTVYYVACFILSLP